MKGIFPKIIVTSNKTNKNPIKPDWRTSVKQAKDDKGLSVKENNRDKSSFRPEELRLECDQQTQRIIYCLSVGRVAWNPNQPDRGIDILKIGMKNPKKGGSLEERLKRWNLSNGDVVVLMTL
ncbi:hypothetical protein BY996DRAFT_6457797 [Phakopsora pachyrhizi]|nr:hypothetical protein BY996DRAFT_6457797 [Phakopsora pachyrhizi]